jgi:hypothetical protein
MRARLRQFVLPVLGVLAALVAALFIVVAIDVLRVDSSVKADDVRFQAKPTTPDGLWDDTGFVPRGIARKLTGIDDDLRYREAVWLYARVQPGRVIVEGPILEGLRGSAQSKITEASQKESSNVRRAQLLNLLGLISMDRYTSDPANRTAIVRDAIGLFASAIETDPQNADAKFNLELALRDFFAPIASGTQTDRGAAQGRQGAAARAGSGY